jgi:hypothetical protein
MVIMPHEAPAFENERHVCSLLAMESDLGTPPLL